MQHVPALHADRALAQRRRDRQAFHAGLQDLFVEAGQGQAAVGKRDHSVVLCASQQLFQAARIMIEKVARDGDVFGVFVSASR